MPATRLLVIAEPKMLVALANGLRAGSDFQVGTTALAHPDALLPLASEAEVIAIFYGSKQWPLEDAIQRLAEPTRARGGRLIAVLQRDQGALRDACFRAGASDLLFMPMPKEVFIARLAEVATLGFTEAPGLRAQVSISRPDQPARTLDAEISAGGISAEGAPGFARGETVQLAWPDDGGFTRWGLVVRSDGAGLRVRIAGSSADEDARLRAWLQGEAALEPASAPRAADGAAPATVPDLVPPTLVETPSLPAPPLEARPVTDAAPTLLEMAAVPPTLLDVKSVGAHEAQGIETPLGATPHGSPSVAAATTNPANPSLSSPGTAPLITPTSTPLASSKTSPGAIAAGPPPGFAARPPIRPQTSRGVGGSTLPGRSREGSAPGGEPAPGTGSSDPQINQPGAAASAALSYPALATRPGSVSTPTRGSAPVAQTSASSAGAAPGAPALHASLFEEGAASPTAPGPAEAAPASEAAPLPRWPSAVLDDNLVRSLAAAMLRDRSLPTDAPPEPGAVVRKVVGALPSMDREALELAGPDSHLHDALAARVQLANANAAGQPLTSNGGGALVDDAAFAALLQLADAASKRLQGEADRAIAKGEVERLQQVTAASAALSRELLALKETADRLRGLAAAPKLGAGALDPNVVAPNAAKPASVRISRDKEKEETRADQRKQALAEFTGLQGAPVPVKRKKRMLAVALVVFAASTINALFFALPGVHTASAPVVEQAGTGVLQISLSDRSAIVSVAATWLAAYDRKARLRSLCDTLDAKGIRAAAIFVDGRGVVGQLQVGTCNPVGLPPPRPPPAEAGATR